MGVGDQAEAHEGPVRSVSVSIPFWCAALAIVLAAAAVRIFASLNELWLDEIWSLELARRVASPLDVLLELRHDNNHPLNTLLLHWIAGLTEDTQAWVYRLPALISGIATVVLAGCIAARRSATEAILALVLTGSSAFLIYYSSEARGYGPAIAFSLLAFWLLEPKDEPRSPLAPVAFWFCVALGLFAHLSFIYAYAALGVWWLAEQRARHASWLPIARNAALWHGVPVATVVLLYLFYVQDLQIGGGPAVSFPALVSSAASLTVGMPLDAPLSWVGAALALALFASGLAYLRRTGSQRWILYALAVVGFPVLILAITRPAYVAPRYFVVSGTFLLLLLAESGAALLRHGREGRMLTIGALGLFILANALHVEPLLRYGRGQYVEALSFMSETSGGPIQVGSDHDLRTGKVVRYYAHLFSPDRLPEYRRKDDWPERGTDWFVLEYAVEEKAERSNLPPRFFVDGRGNRYELTRGYPSAPLSGVDWFLYRNASILDR